MSSESTNLEELRDLTGTRKRTPVTMEVNAVPPILREYKLPSIPAVNALIAETTSERLNIKLLAILLVANAAEEITTLTNRLSPFLYPCHGCLSMLNGNSCAVEGARGYWSYCYWLQDSSHATNGSHENSSAPEIIKGN